MVETIALPRRRCSRCDRALEATRILSHAVEVCPGCGGLWLAGAARVAMVLEMRPEAPSAEHVAAMCPECAKQMRALVTIGVLVEVCDEHGVWLDATLEDGMQMFLALTELPA